MRTRLFLALVLFATLIFVPAVGAASNDGIGSPTLRVIQGSDNKTAVIVADGITDGGSPGNGAISWDIFFVLPSTVTLNDFNVTAGPAWSPMCPGFFTVVKVGQGVFLGGNAFMISGFCVQPPASAVTGSNVTVATLTFTSSCTTTGAFDVNLSTGPVGDSTDMFDSTNTLHLFTEADLTDGGNVCGNPTAVTMTGLDAASGSAAPFAAAAWPLLAGAAAVAAGGAYALLRRKS